jgi:SAM-dependent methyltransferase
MSNHWLDAQVVGLDISPKSIETAQKLFGSDRVSFREGILTKDTLSGSFDLIVLMDVYEHIALTDRPVLHEALQHLLSDAGRIVLSFPTPRHLAYLRKYDPDNIQPVDEDIDVHVIAKLATDTATEVLFYKEVDIWHPRDYAHAVLSRPIPDWTPDSYKQENLKLRQEGRVGRIVRKIINGNPLWSRRTSRIQLIREKLGENAL